MGTDFKSVPVHEKKGVAISGAIIVFGMALLRV
jgi:hypothetical protein